MIQIKMYDDIVMTLEVWYIQEMKNNLISLSLLDFLGYGCFNKGGVLHVYKGVLFFFFLIHVGCPGQLTRTTTIPHGSLDILQAQEQVRHRGGDRRAHRGSNPGGGRNKSTMDHSS